MSQPIDSDSTIDQIRALLSVYGIWDRGYRGQNVIVGIVTDTISIGVQPFIGVIGKIIYLVQVAVVINVRIIDVGGLVAIIGGLLFLVITIRAMWPPRGALLRPAARNAGRHISGQAIPGAGR